jgi:hypothetical protein
MNDGNQVRPGDFPIGSALSRAAARAFLKSRRDTRKRIIFISNVWLSEDSGNERNEPQFGPWQDWGDTLMRFVYQPSVWLKPGDSIPSCPGCGTPFKKASEYPNMACYQANCLERHDPDRVA